MQIYHLLLMSLLTIGRSVLDREAHIMNKIRAKDRTLTLRIHMRDDNANTKLVTRDAPSRTQDDTDVTTDEENRFFKREVPCEEVECQNGVCMQGRNDYSPKCECYDGFSGNKCDRLKLECNENKWRCLNGRCENHHGTHMCRCDNGLVGLDCQEKAVANPCSKHSHISQVHTIRGFGPTMPQMFAHCISNDTFIARRCPRSLFWDQQAETCTREYPVAPEGMCASYPCANGGQCVDQGTDYSCVCAPGYYGKDCTNRIDMCTSNPCHGGRCTSWSGGYTCECPDRVFDTCCCNGVVNRCSRGVDFYVHNATSFVHCGPSGEAYLKACPAGLLWQNDIKTCVRPNSYAHYTNTWDYNYRRSYKNNKKHDQLSSSAYKIDEPVEMSTGEEMDIDIPPSSSNFKVDIPMDKRDDHFIKQQSPRVDENSWRSRDMVRPEQRESFDRPHKSKQVNQRVQVATLSPESRSEFLQTVPQKDREMEDSAYTVDASWYPHERELSSKFKDAVQPDIHSQQLNPIPERWQIRNISDTPNNRHETWSEYRDGGGRTQKLVKTTQSDDTSSAITGHNKDFYQQDTRSFDRLHEYDQGMTQNKFANAEFEDDNVAPKRRYDTISGVVAPKRGSDVYKTDSQDGTGQTRRLSDDNVDEISIPHLYRKDFEANRQDEISDQRLTNELTSDKSGRHEDQYDEMHRVAYRPRIDDHREPMNTKNMHSGSNGAWDRGYQDEIPNKNTIIDMKQTASDNLSPYQKAKQEYPQYVNEAKLFKSDRILIGDDGLTKVDKATLNSGSQRHDENILHDSRSNFVEPIYDRPTSSQSDLPGIEIPQVYQRQEHDIRASDDIYSDSVMPNTAPQNLMQGIPAPRAYAHNSVNRVHPLQQNVWSSTMTDQSNAHSALPDNQVDNYYSVQHNELPEMAQEIPDVLPLAHQHRTIASGITPSRFEDAWPSVPQNSHPIFRRYAGDDVMPAEEGFKSVQIAQAPVSYSTKAKIMPVKLLEYHY